MSRKLLGKVIRGAYHTLPLSLGTYEAHRSIKNRKDGQTTGAALASGLIRGAATGLSLRTLGSAGKSAVSGAHSSALVKTLAAGLLVPASHDIVDLAGLEGLSPDERFLPHMRE